MILWVNVFELYGLSWTFAVLHLSSNLPNIVSVKWQKVTNAMASDTLRHQWHLFLTWINFNPSEDK